MPLYHTEDQAMLADTARSFMAEEGAIAKQLRHWRDQGCKDGFGHGLWKQFAELGLTGVLVAEADGGLGMGHVEAGIVLEEIGRNLTPSPFLTSSVMAATAIGAGSDDLKGRYLPGLLSGDSVFAVAIDEGAKHRPERIATRADRSGNGFRLTGKKDFVVHGASADMIVVAARPGMGKTSIALNFIEAALFPKPSENRKPSNVLLFSLEMPARELALRLLCSRARVNMQKLRTAHPDERMQVDLVQAANEYKGLPLVVDDNGGQNILEIRAKCRRVHARTPLDMVVIDYIQLINGLDSGLPREQQIAEVSRSIKAMAKEFKIPIIALAQLNRKSEDEARQPRMSDLRESGSIEQDADIVMLISKPPISQGKAAEAEAEQAGQDGCYSRQLIVAKNRNGPTSDINLLFNPGLTRFENPAKDYRNNE